MKPFNADIWLVLARSYSESDENHATLLADEKQCEHERNSKWKRTQKQLQIYQKTEYIPFPAKRHNFSAYYSEYYG